MLNNSKWHIAANIHNICWSTWLRVHVDVCVCVCGTDCCKRGTELHAARQLPDWLWLLGGISYKDGFSGSPGAYLGLANSFVSFTILLCCAPCVSFSSLLCLYYVVCLHSFSIFNALWLCVGHRLATLFIVPAGINFVNCCCPIVVVTTTATTTTTTTWLYSFVVVVIAACRIKLYQQLSRVSLQLHLQLRLGSRVSAVPSASRGFDKCAF